MLVGIDQGGNDGPAGQVHAVGTWRRLSLTLPADPGEEAVLN